MPFLRKTNIYGGDMHFLQFIRVMIGAVVLAITPLVTAQTFPNKSVKIIAPFGAGGSVDAVSRILADRLSEMWGQPVVVENRAGAGGNVGAEAVARSPADGYTLLMCTVATHGINQSLYKKLAYDPIKDFAPISLVASTLSVLVLHPSAPFKSVPELISFAKSNPGKLNFGSTGNGSSHHLAGVLFNSLAGVNTVHIPYKSTAAMVSDLVAGQFHFTFDTLPTALPQLKAGKTRPLAVTTRERSAFLPDLPTMDEAGVKGFEVSSWYGVLAPAGTPREVINKINADIQQALKSPDVQKRLNTAGATPTGSSVEQMTAHIDAELKKWAIVVQASGASVD
jgi:tripartite-type tricarboxylate transporter receptor subunit TctC